MGNKFTFKSYYKLREVAEIEKKKRIVDSQVEQTPQKIGRVQVDKEKDVNFFTYGGDFWHIGFEGETKSIRNLCGIKYIAMLLEKPNCPISCLEFNPAVNGSASGDGTMADRRARAEGLNGPTWTKDSKRANDPETEEKYKKHLKELLDDRNKCTNEMEKNLIQKDINIYMELLKNFNDPSLKRIQSLIKGNITFAYKAIRKAGMKRLAEHLAKNITPGGKYNYLYREAKTTWKISW